MTPGHVYYGHILDTGVNTGPRHRHSRLLRGDGKILEKEKEKKKKSH